MRHTKIGKKANHTKEATEYLKTWFASNLYCPYISTEDKYKLSELSGLTRKQITTWLNNTRRVDRIERMSTTNNKECSIMYVSRQKICEAEKQLLLEQEELALQLWH